MDYYTKLAIFFLWCLIEIPGNALLALCVYFERVHNRHLYRAIKDRLLSSVGVIFVLHNVFFNPLYVYRALSEEPLSITLCMVMSLESFLSALYNFLLPIDYLIVFLLAHLELQR